MPELPEVEITRRSIEPRIAGRTITCVTVRDPRLRWPVPARLPRLLAGRTVQRVARRAKYLLLECDGGTLILHLGMSGSLRILERQQDPGRHDHLDIAFGSRLLRLRDPRRFGSVLWHTGGPAQHRLLRGLGVEPLEEAFCGDLVYRLTRGRQTAIKPFLMNQAIVVGVGNIYASESLFGARIDPRTRAGTLARTRCERLAAAVKGTLNRALAAGGSTLRDFAAADGRQGYFQLETFVYGRAGEPCRVCGGAVREIRQGQRSTCFCPGCQR
ncbi:MAG: bifunctional DNA-formamidopyrimidine glycosylase/DNA-(apurinic or apyrimidinic site) lyase [Burkholderiales bacterium]|nr:bifunctional DNA-formamidopyrimidine glycosylase/DNA-(apurinic or apyrimidinic site) lyase [Burkholderiales bacterium]